MYGSPPIPLRILAAQLVAAYFTRIESHPQTFKRCSRDMLAGHETPSLELIRVVDRASLGLIEPLRRAFRASSVARSGDQGGPPGRNFTAKAAHSHGDRR